MTEIHQKEEKGAISLMMALIAHLESRNSMEMSDLCTHVAYEEDEEDEEDLDYLFKNNRSSKRATRATRAVVETAECQ